MRFISFAASIKMNLFPPRCVGLVKLDREKFKKIVSVPTISYQPQDVSMNTVMRILKTYLMKVEKFRPVGKSKIHLNPDVITEWKELPTEALENAGIKSSSFKFEDIELSFDNWKAEDLVKSILPDGIEPATSYSRIGHIIHMNLKDNLLPYKTAIAEIYKDKTVGCRTVVNKAQNIDNTFRNFQIDLLLGDPDYQVQVKENGAAFEFDFSTVYWNPRLSMEHERIVKLLEPNDILYDVFAGVGPFAVPAGKKRVTVMANDLNPHSYKWLAHNVTKNKVGHMVKTFNKDGRDFILQDIRDNLLERIVNREQEMKEYSIHITMNLPGLAVTFLDAFIGLLKDNKQGITSSSTIPTPLCHCYCFVKGQDDPKMMAQQLVEQNLGIKLERDVNLKEINFVRNVAPNKDMMRVDLLLTNDILFSSTAKRSLSSSDDFPIAKKSCMKFRII